MSNLDVELRTEVLQVRRKLNPSQVLATCTGGPRTPLRKFGINRHHLDICPYRSGVSSDCDLEEFTTGVPRNLRNPKDPTSLSKRSVIDFRILRRHLLEHLEINSAKDTLSLPPRPWVLPEPRHHRRRNI